MREKQTFQILTDERGKYVCFKKAECEILVDYEDVIQLRLFTYALGLERRPTTTYVRIGNSSLPAGYQYLHRLLCTSDKDVDHIDGDGLNNRRYNLRAATRQQNLRNQKRTRGVSAFKGVAWHKQRKKWRAYFVLDGRQYHLGLFVSEIKAAQAYDRAALKYFGEFASLNNP